MLNCSIWPIDRTLSSTTILGMSGAGSIGNEGFSGFPNAPALLKPHHQIVLCHIQSTHWNWGITHLQRCSRYILLLRPTELFLKQEGSYMGKNTYASLSQRVNPIRGRNQADKYQVPVEKLIQQELNDWLKFQEKLKNLRSSEIYQTEAQTKLKKKKKTTHKWREIRWNNNRKTYTKFTAQTQTTFPTKIQNLLQNKCHIDFQSVHQKTSKIQNPSNQNQRLSLINPEKSMIENPQNQE